MRSRCSEAVGPRFDERGRSRYLRAEARANVLNNLDVRGASSRAVLRGEALENRVGINRRFSGWAVSAEYVNRPRDKNATQVAEPIMCRRLGTPVWEVIGAAATKPFGFMNDALNEQSRSVKGSRILALGVAYKAGVGDIRDSPALEIIETLQARGAQVDYADPRVAQVQVGGHLLKAVAWEPADLASYDLALLLTTHPEFDPRRLVAEARLVVDTRNATGPLGAHRHVIRI